MYWIISLSALIRYFHWRSVWKPEGSSSCFQSVCGLKTCYHLQTSTFLRYPRAFCIRRGRGLCNRRTISLRRKSLTLHSQCVVGHIPAQKVDGQKISRLDKEEKVQDTNTPQNTPVIFLPLPPQPEILIHSHMNTKLRFAAKCNQQRSWWCFALNVSQLHQLLHTWGKKNHSLAFPGMCPNNPTTEYSVKWRS